MARIALLLLVGAIAWTGRGLIVHQSKKATKMTLAQVEARLPIDAGWSGYVKDVHCQQAQPPFDYACTFVNYGTVRNARAGRGGSLIKVGVIDTNGHAVTGQEVGVNDPLGPPPPTS